MKNKAHSQRGISLLELLIALGLLSGLAYAITTAFSEDGGRGKTAFLVAGQMSVAQVKFANDTSCFANTPQALLDPAKAVAASTFCNKDVSARWKGPYIQFSNIINDGTRDVYVVKDMNVYFSRYQNGGKAYYTVDVSGLSSESAQDFMYNCLKTNFKSGDVATGNAKANVLANQMCVVDTDLGTNPTGTNITVSLRIAERAR